VFAAGDVAEAVGVKDVGGGRGAGRCRGGGAGIATGSWRTAARRNGGGIAAGEAGVNVLDGVLQIHQLLIDLADAGFDLLEVVGEALDLGGHGVEAGAGVGLNVLDGFLEGAHGGVVALQLEDSRATAMTGLGPMRLPAMALASRAPEKTRMLRARMMKTSENWEQIGNNLRKGRIASQSSNVLGD